MKITDEQRRKVEELFYTKKGKMSSKLLNALNHMKLAVEDADYKIRVYKQYGKGRFTSYEANAVYQVINELYKLFINPDGITKQNDSISGNAKSGEYIESGSFETILKYISK